MTGPFSRIIWDRVTTREGVGLSVTLLLPRMTGNIGGALFNNQRLVTGKRRGDIA